MALDFPNTPTNGQSFTTIGTTWVWDGTKWTANSTVAAMSSIYLPLTGGTLTGALTLPVGAQGTPSLNFTGDLTSGLYRKSAGYLGLSIVGSDVMTWNNTGKTTTSLGVIAVNTTPPSTTLVGSVVAERLVLPADGVYFNGYTTGGGNWLRYATGHSAWIGGSPGSAISLQLTTASGAAGSSAISSITQWVFDGPTRALTLPGPLLIPVSNGSIELGHLTIVNTPLIDFHSSGNNNDYDVRLIASGGAAATGSGTLNIYATNTIVTGGFQSNTGNIISYGGRIQSVNSGVGSQATISCWNQTAAAAIGFYMDSANLQLNFGGFDGTGLATVYWGNISGGSLYHTGQLTAGGSVVGYGGVYAVSDATMGMWSAGAVRYHQYAGGWYWLYTTATGTLVWHNGNNSTGQQWTMRADLWTFNEIGPVGGVGAFQVLSDDRAKENATPAKCGLDEVMRIEPIIFQYAGNDKTHIGFSAQQLRKVIPEVVSVAGFALFDGSGGIDTDDPSLSVGIDGIVAALVNAVKTLTQRVHALEGRHV